jgi:molecular chaperone HscB
MADCWSCGAERGEASRCVTCARLQPVSPRLTHFDLLGVERRMALDVPALDAAFRERSRAVHPDRFGHGSPVERRLALEHTARLNEAHRVLRDPQRRAEYLLGLEGLAVGHETARTTDAALLAEMLELQEEVEGARTEGALAALQVDLEARRGRLMAAVTRYLDDREGAAAGAARALDELRYVRRLLETVERRREEMS